MQSLPLQASKWLKIQVLLDSCEMQDLCNTLEGILFFPVGQVVDKKQKRMNTKEFLQNYFLYILQLKEKKIPEREQFSGIFNQVLTSDQDSVFNIEVNDKKQIFQMAKPAIKMQLHTMGYSKEEQKFRAQVMGKDSIQWGLQFSYPQLYLDPKEKKVINVFKEPISNTELFRRMQRWMREHTIPTPFIVASKKINSPIRLGKKCLYWINDLKELQVLGISIQRENSEN